MCIRDSYIAYVIFLVIVYVLYTSFFGPLTEMPVIGGLSGLTALPLSICWVLLYHMGIVLAIFSGLIAGILSEGRVCGGLKHVFVMLALAYVVFREMIEPTWLFRLLGLI